MKYQQSRSFTFTSFLDKVNFEIQIKLIKNERYLIVGLETCPTTNKQHFQGYIQFNDCISFTQAKKRLPTGAHIEYAYGNYQDNFNYCSKETIFLQRGEPKNQGQRTDLIQLMDDIKENKSFIQIAESYPETYERYYRFCDRYKALLDAEKEKQTLEKFKLENVQLNPFQQKIINCMETQSEREVLWVSDPIGNTGKTFLSKVLLASKNAFRTTNGKSKDIAHAYNGEPIFIMDLSRSLQDRVNYDIIEQIKNGLLFSGKYNSRHKVFDIPKVLILANFQPELNKLSLDRWQKF